MWNDSEHGHIMFKSCLSEIIPFEYIVKYSKFVLILYFTISSKKTIFATIEAFNQPIIHRPVTIRICSVRMDMEHPVDLGKQL